MSAPERTVQWLAISSLPVAKIERGELPPPKPEGDAAASAPATEGGGAGDASDGAAAAPAGGEASAERSSSAAQQPKLRLQKVGGSRASLLEQSALRELIWRQKRASKVCAKAWGTGEQI